MAYFKKSTALLALLIAVAGAQPGLAQQPIALTTAVKVVRIVQDESGVSPTRLEAPDTVVPGDRLVFRTSYSNSSTEAVQSFVVTSPLPSAVRLAPDADASLVVSVDGGRTLGELSELMVTGLDGILRAATADDVTLIRWTIAVVQPGESGMLEYPGIIR